MFWPFKNLSGVSLSKKGRYKIAAQRVISGKKYVFHVSHTYWNISWKFPSFTCWKPLFLYFWDDFWWKSFHITKNDQCFLISKILGKLENMPPNVNNNIKNVAKIVNTEWNNSPKKCTASTAKYKAHSQFLRTNFWKHIYICNWYYIHILKTNYYLIPVFNVFVVIVNVFITFNLLYEMNKLLL